MAKDLQPRLQVVSANDLVSGEVVYLATHGHWTGDLNSAQLAIDNPQADELLAAANRDSDKVVSIELIVVNRVDGGLVPQTLREQLRLAGPSIDYARHTYFNTWNAGRVSLR